MNKRLDYLLRKNKGDKILLEYKNIFFQSGFAESDLQYIELEECDRIIKHLHSLPPREPKEYENIDGDCRDVTCSTLLNSALQEFGNEDCYISTENSEYCGMFLCESRIALKTILQTAFANEDMYFTILNKEIKFIFTITYHDEKNYDFPNEFDIQCNRWRIHSKANNCK